MWEEKSISDVANIISGGTPKTAIRQYWDGDISWLSVKDFSGEKRKVYTTEKTITKEGLENSAATLIYEGDIVISARGTVGELVQVGIPMTFNQSCFGLSAKKGFINDFIYYALKYYVKRLKAFSNGAVFDTIIRETFTKIKIPVPSLPTQQKIADILSAYDDLIENNNRRIEFLEQAAQQLYKEWFVRFRFPGYEKVHFTKGIPDGWEFVKLGSVVKINCKSIDKKYKFYDINYIDISSVEHGNILSKTHYAIEQAPGRAKRIVTDGDVIWSMVRPNLRGYSIILTPEPNDIASTGFAVLTPKKVPFSFLYYLVTDDSFVDYLSNYARGSAYPAVTSAEFENAKLLLPPLELLSKFHLSTEPFFREASILKQKNQNLIKQRDLLLPRLMSGKLEV